MVTIKGNSKSGAGGCNVLLRYARSSNTAFAILGTAFILFGFAVGIIFAGTTPSSPMVTKAADAFGRASDQLNSLRNRERALLVEQEKVKQKQQQLAAAAGLTLNNPVSSNSSAFDGGPIEELLDAVNKERLLAIADDHRGKYKRGLPFPHLVLDDLFPASIIHKIEQELPESKVGPGGCYKGAPRNKCFKHSKSFKKTGVAQEALMGKYTRVFMAILKSANFVSFLERLSGIDGLVPDPKFYGSGLHVIAKEGFLGVHADFNWSPDLQLHRRVNAFVFFNPDWKDEYGGHLELWNKNMTQCMQRIAPMFGRFVVFSSTDFSYHGHPQPLTPPDGRARRSMALYYYTATRPVTECEHEQCNGHSTLHQNITGDCKKCQDPVCNALPSTPTKHFTIE